MSNPSLTVPGAIRLAQKFLRRVVSAEEFALWLKGGLGHTRDGDGNVSIPCDALNVYLGRIEDAEKLLTVGETRDRVARDHGLWVTARTVKRWLVVGYPTPEGEYVKLPYVYSPVYSATKRLIRPPDLDEFMQKAGPNLGKRGRPSLARGK